MKPTTTELERRIAVLEKENARLRKMLVEVEQWMGCDLDENGPGPAGGYQQRLRAVRRVLAGKSTEKKGA